MTNDNWKPLSAEAVETLQTNRCRCLDWKQVRVTAGFEPARVTDAVFSGAIRIGKLNGEAAEIRHADLHNVSVGDNCRIVNVQGRLSNLDVEDNVCVENVGSIACENESSFGNGHEVSALNEGGGRDLRITTETSAQIAYLTVLYRDRQNLIEKLDAMATSFAKAAKSARAQIGRSSVIRNAGAIVDVRVGPFAVIDGVLSLRNGTVDSSEEAPTKVGSGVMADDFIFQKGSSVEDGAMISAGLVGEGSRIGKQFSAENSLFFANSEGFHSEVCSVFCGPYSVTHHRSTLLIGAMSSFFNAGSGTNQSNHMYKLGPLHQGILERGCKTGSFAYLLWPCRVGAFTAVIGKHKANFDTSDFPFSYIAEEGGKSTLVPAMNFFTVGTLRDGEKWPARDRRTGNSKLDTIVFDVLSPFTAQKMIRGMDILADLSAKADKSQEYVTHQGILIKRLLLKTCGRYYKLALDKYFGDVLVNRLERLSPSTIQDILKPDEAGSDGNDEWIDVGGLLCPQKRVNALTADIVSGEIATFEALHHAFRAIAGAYEADAWNWALAHAKRLHGQPLESETSEGLRDFLDKWKTASLKLLNMVLGDAQKEFEGDVRIGFGIDGNQDADFDAVRGAFEDNAFTKKLQDDIVSVNEKYEKACKLAP